MIKALARKAVISGIRAYRYFISPLLGQHCRFHPTCSAYAIEAIERHGAVRGSYLTMHRLLRCQPLSQGGFDPVPAGRSLSRARDLR